MNTDAQTAKYHTAQLTPKHYILASNIFFNLLFSFFGHIFISVSWSVCLSSFACMFLNNVAIMYKSLALYASKILSSSLSVFFPLCALSAPSRSSLVSLVYSLHSHYYLSHSSQLSACYTLWHYQSINWALHSWTHPSQHICWLLDLACPPGLIPVYSTFFVIVLTAGYYGLHRLLSYYILECLPCM